MRIGLIDVDSHNFPNLALMRISAYHKARGDTVEWWDGWEHYDTVYMSKVFSDAYSPDEFEPVNAERVVKGGTGYCISLVNGKEVYDKSKDWQLPSEIEQMFPDYSIYPQYDFAVSMTSRGCPRRCPFCHVSAKEGRKSIKVADVSNFWKRGGQREIKVLDPNITACPDKRDLFKQYCDTGVWIDFTQGLDIRLLNDEDVADIKRMKLKGLHFAWDNPKDRLREKFEWFAKQMGGAKDSHGRNGTVYVLTNFNSTEEEDLYRVYALRELGYAPYIMVYDKTHAPVRVKRLQRWVNNKIIFYKVPRFEDYMRVGDV